MPHSISEKIINNTIFNAIGRFWGILVSIILTPYIIHHIGLEKYGILTLVGVATGYFGLLDFGIGTSFVKFISEFHTRKELLKINQVLVTGVVFYFIFSIVLIIFGFFAGGPLVKALKLQPKFYSEALVVFYMSLVTFGISCVSLPFVSVIGGLQRMDISNKLGIILSVLNALGTVVCLMAGYGLPGLMVNGLIITLLNGICSVLISFKLLPELSLTLSGYDVATFRKLFNFGIKLQVTTLANMFHFQIDKLLLAYLLNVELVSYYNIASQLASKIRDIPLMLLSAVFPAASELGARTDSEGLKKLYFRSMKYMVLAGLPIFVMGFLFARPFIFLWLGDGYQRAALSLQVFMLAYFLNILSGPGFTILNGIGLPKYGMLSSALAAGLNLVLSFGLILIVGFYGVVLGTALSMMAGAIFFMAEFHRVMKISVLDTALKVMVKPLLAVLFPTAIVVLLTQRAGNTNWYGLFGLASGFTVMFAVSTLLLRCFDDFDKGLIKTCLSKARRRLSVVGWGGVP